MYRLRDMVLAIWYTLFLNRFGIRDGSLYIPETLVQGGDVLNLVRRIPLEKR